MEEGRVVIRIMGCFVIPPEDSKIPMRTVFVDASRVTKRGEEGNVYDVCLCNGNASGQVRVLVCLRESRQFTVGDKVRVRTHTYRENSPIF